MELNTVKCATASSLIDQHGHCSILDDSVQFKGVEVPTLTMLLSLSDLGTAVSARRTIQLEAAQTKLTDMAIELQKITRSQLAIDQIINANKTFLLPTLDFTMLWHGLSFIRGRCLPASFPMALNCAISDAKG
jgi:hypothetical protein